MGLGPTLNWDTLAEGLACMIWKSDKWLVVAVTVMFDVFIVVDNGTQTLVAASQRAMMKRF